MLTKLILRDDGHGSYLHVYYDKETFAIYHGHDPEKTDSGPILDIIELEREDVDKVLNVLLNFIEEQENFEW